MTTNNKAFTGFTSEQKAMIRDRIMVKVDTLLNMKPDETMSRNEVGLLSGCISNSAVQAGFDKACKLTLAMTAEYILSDHTHEKMTKGEKLNKQIAKLDANEKAKLIAILTKKND